MPETIPLRVLGNFYTARQVPVSSNDSSDAIWVLRGVSGRRTRPAEIAGREATGYVRSPLRTRRRRRWNNRLRVASATDIAGNMNYRHDTLRGALATASTGQGSHDREGVVMTNFGELRNNVAPTSVGTFVLLPRRTLSGPPWNATSAGDAPPAFISPRHSAAYKDRIPPPFRPAAILACGGLCPCTQPIATNDATLAGRPAAPPLLARRRKRARSQCAPAPSNVANDFYKTNLRTR